MPKHIVVEAHLITNDAIHNHFKVGASAADLVKKMLEDTYKPPEPKKNEKPAAPLVTVPIVSYRLSDVADTIE